MPHGKFASLNQKHYPDQGSDMSLHLIVQRGLPSWLSLSGTCDKDCFFGAVGPYSQRVFALTTRKYGNGQTSGRVAKCWVFSQASFHHMEVTGAQAAIHKLFNHNTFQWELKS